MANLEDFIHAHNLTRTQGISVVTTSDLAHLKSAGHTVEELLDHLTTKYHSLLHGSRADMFYDPLASAGGIIYAANLASIALLKAIISNRNLQHPGLEYPYFINSKHPLEVRIHGIKKDTIGKSGFVYILNQREGFENIPQTSWQYLKKAHETPFAAKIPVEKSDFTYPIFDVAHNKTIIL